MPENVITLTGNLTADPELRFTPSGAAVASFTVAQTPRYFDRNSDEWKDGDTLFMRCSAWRQLAENIAESCRRGQRVMVTGKLHQRSFEDREGNNRTVIEMECDDVAASMKFATVKSTRADRASENEPEDDADDNPPARSSVSTNGGRKSQSRQSQRAGSRR